MRPRFTLDIPSFEKLLAALLILQCQHDRQINQGHDETTTFVDSSARDELGPAVALTSRGNGLKQARAGGGGDELQVFCKGAEQVPAAHKLTVASLSRQPAVAGALALAEARRRPAVPDPIPVCSLAEISNGTPVETDWAASRGGPLALSLVRVESREHVVPAPNAIHSDSALRTAVACVEPVVVLLIMVAFLFSQPWRHPPGRTLSKATPQTSQAATQSTSVRTSQSMTSLEPSHLQVTDPAIESVVEALSRYEMRTLRRQAEYGDDDAALTLGMAYETGHFVPQSCTKAAQWVTAAASQGNAAAQYNLALRLLNGDGVRTDLEEASKWLDKAAAHGYRKAEFALHMPPLHR